MPKRTAELAAALDARVAELGGDRPIHSVLVANNGLAATKFMRSVRSWAYKNFGSERAGACGGVLRVAAGCCYVGGWRCAGASLGWMVLLLLPPAVTLCAVSCMLYVAAVRCVLHCCASALWQLSCGGVHACIWLL